MDTGPSLLPGPVNHFQKTNSGAAQANNPSFLLAKASHSRCRDYFTPYPSFEFKKVLGFGGYGVALKFEQNNENNEHLRYFVAKVPKDPSDEDLMNGFRNEMRFYMRLDASEHVPRLIDLHLSPSSERGQQDNTCERRVPGGNDDFWKHGVTQNVMILEHLEYNDLEEHLFRLGDAAKDGDTEMKDRSDEDSITSPKKSITIRNRVLWRFFLCLTRACIAFAWPRKTEADVEEEISSQQFAVGSFNENSAGDVPPWHEVPPARGRGSRICHFDIDPANVFIGEPNPVDTEHALHPIAKIADYNLMGEIKRDTNIFFLRVHGKNKTHAPEQFDRTVGSHWRDFGSHTNIWGIGLVMFNLITHSWIPPEARSSSPRRTPTNSDLSRATDTYGFHVYDDIATSDSDPYPAYDLNLRYLVMRCMARDYQDRPDLRELLSNIEENIQDGDDMEMDGENAEDENDEALKQLYDDYFHNAPERVDPWKSSWDAMVVANG
ncbi:kinase-like domain-containing protein [Xylariales sp. AK1849]|nr:kinase-like domain-containing protein [Xylariales sp. AK1849]